MTQAALAARLHVTDKAVSRWERGLGFPDISTIEPLAAALGVSVLELMRSERLPEGAVSSEEASEAVTQALDMAQQDKSSRFYNAFPCPPASCSGLWPCCCSTSATGAGPWFSACRC